MMRMICIIAAASAMLCSAAKAQSGLTHEELAAVFNDNGVSATIDGDSISAQAVGVAFNVQGFNCSSGGQCTEFIMFAGFDLAEGFPIDRINEWNWETNAGRASLDEEGDPYLDHTFSVSGAGDVGAVSETLTLWQASLLEFMEYIGFGAAQA